MRRATAILAVAAAMTLGVGGELFARGPGGRGGGRGFQGGGGAGARGGGFSRPSGGADFSPSLGGGRVGGVGPGGAVGRPGGVAPGTRPGGAAGFGQAGRPAGVGGVGQARRPTAGQLNDFLDIPRAGAGTVGGGAGGAAADFLRESGNRPAAGLAGERPGLGDRVAGDRPLANRPGAENRQNRRQGAAQNRPQRIDNRQQWLDNRQERWGEVRNQVAERYPRLDFWSDHPGWAAWRIDRPYRWATWAALTGWVGYGWGEPSYYSYGENIYYQDGGVYYDQNQVATAEDYAQQAQAIASSAPETDPSQSEWMPLGVFAVTQDGEATGATPTLFLQLVISKEGILSGTLNNKLTGETQTIEGMADKESQRAAWTVQGKKWPVMETGIYNLTQDAAPALVHFADGQTQQWLLVRLPDPQGQGQ